MKKSGLKVFSLVTGESLDTLAKEGMKRLKGFGKDSEKYAKGAEKRMQDWAKGRKS